MGPVLLQGAGLGPESLGVSLGTPAPLPCTGPRPTLSCLSLGSGSSPPCHRPRPINHKALTALGRPDGGPGQRGQRVTERAIGGRPSAHLIAPAQPSPAARRPLIALGRGRGSARAGPV